MLETSARLLELLSLLQLKRDWTSEVIEGDELAVAFDRLAARFRRAAGGASTT